MLIKKILIILFQNTYFYVSENTAFLPSPPVCGYVRKHIPLDGYTMPFRFVYRTDDISERSLSLDTSAVWYTNVNGIE